MDSNRIFAFLGDGLERGERAALVTIVAVTGSSMRSPGTHMAVLESGAFAGSLSGGCIEAAIVSEAVEAIRANAVRTVRFGAGSPYLDIKLPCGGSVDVHFLPVSDASAITRANDAFENRQPFRLTLPVNNGEMRFEGKAPKSKIKIGDGQVTVSHWPIPRILIIGHGATVFSLATQAMALGAEVSALTPDADLAIQLGQASISAKILRTTGDVNLIDSDSSTAIVFLFHDHDWEQQLLLHCMRQPHFYLGAMGGRTAHAARVAALEAQGAEPDEVARICAPIGLFHSSRNPDTLAVSVLAEIMKAHSEIEAGRLPQSNG